MINKRSGIICLMAMLALLVVLGALLLLNGQRAEATAGVLYVAADANCGGMSPCFSTVQASVDAAQPSDEIRVAAGTYLGVNNQGGLSQAVYIDKSLTIRGGFTTSNWSIPDPDANVTELNAMTLGRVVYVTGVSTTLTLEGLHLTYGDSTGLGGHTPPGQNYDAGGGVFVDEAGVTLNRCTISQNFAPSSGYGGGIYVGYGTLTMTGTLVEANEAGNGGGVYLYKSSSEILATSIFRLNDGSAIHAEEGTFTLRDSQLLENENGGASTKKAQVMIAGNVISGTIGGNGLSVSLGSGSISNNRIQANEHAGLSIFSGVFSVVGNEISYNQGDSPLADPGVSIDGGSSILVGNFIHHNQNTYAASNGGGIYIDAPQSGWITLTANIIQDNIAGEQAGLPSHGYGGGVYINGDNVTLERNLIQNNAAIGFIWAGNQYWGGFGGGLYLTGNPMLINNIIADNMILAPDTTHFHAPGIYVNGGSPELIHNTLAHNHGGDGVGLYAIEDSFSGQRSQVEMFNTILVSHTVGVYAPGESANNVVVADGILWSGNISNTWGTGTFFVDHAYTGDPSFIDPVGGDYHISPGSAAIDIGVATDVNRDIDGEPRFGVPDLGADEYWAPGALKRVYIPLVLRQQQARK